MTCICPLLVIRMRMIRPTSSGRRCDEVERPVEGLHISKRKSSFKSPDFSKPVKTPNFEQAKKFIEDVALSSPKEPVSCYCGHAKNVSWGSPLNPEPAILENPDLQDLHSPYLHVSADSSATPFHIEDFGCEGDYDTSPRRYGFWSCNLVPVGWKLWIFIEDYQTSLRSS